MASVLRQGVKEGTISSPATYIVCISVGRRERGRPRLRWNGTLCFGMEIYSPIFVTNEGKEKLGNWSL
jgi:hypothetical protein